VVAPALAAGTCAGACSWRVPPRRRAPPRPGTGRSSRRQLPAAGALAAGLAVVAGAGSGRPAPRRVKDNRARKRKETTAVAPKM